MASARYDKDGYCLNIQFLMDNDDDWLYCNGYHWNFSTTKFRLKPEPQYKPFDVESFKPYRDCWFMVNNSDIIFKVVNYYDEGITIALYGNKLATYSWEYFMKNFTIDGKPAGVEVNGHS